MQIDLKYSGLFRAFLFIFHGGSHLILYFFFIGQEILNIGEDFIIGGDFAKWEFGVLYFGFFLFAIFHNKNPFVVFM